MPSLDNEPLTGQEHYPEENANTDIDGIEELRRQLRGVLEDMPQDPALVLKRAKDDAKKILPLFSPKWRMTRVAARRGVFRNLEDAVQILYKRGGSLSSDERVVQEVAEDFTERLTEAETWLMQKHLPRDRSAMDRLHQTMVILSCDPEFENQKEQLQQLIINANRAIGKEHGEKMPWKEEM